MAFRSSLTRTLMSTARSSSLRSTPPLPRLRPPSSPSAAPRLLPRRLSFSNPRTLGELGCAQSLMPMLAGVGLTSHIAANLRAYSELSHGLMQPLMYASCFSTRMYLNRSLISIKSSTKYWEGVATSYYPGENFAFL